MTVARIHNSVAEEHEHIARFRLKVNLVVVGIVEQSQRQTCRIDGLDLPFVQ